MYFHHQYSPLHIVQKPTFNTQKIIAEKSDFSKLSMQFHHLLKMKWFYPHYKDFCQWVILILTEIAFIPCLFFLLLVIT